MTPYRCTSGMFVGVDLYDGLPPSKTTFSAASDASRLQSYFAGADPDGLWTTVTDGSRGGAVTRLDFVEALHRWIKGVERSSAGLFYFAGHGTISDHGLTLAAGDFSSRFPADSGIPLRRVIEIISQYGRADSRYILMLDCCRSSEGAFPRDAVPSNVSVIYACAPGDAAAELDEGGAYCSAVLSWLEGADAILIDGIGYCRLDTAAEAIGKVISHRWSRAIQVPEQFGADPKQILLPRRRSRAANSSYDKGSTPRVCLKTRIFGTPGELDLAFDALSLISFQYGAITASDFDSALDICQRHERRVEVWFDFARQEFDYLAFFDLLISRYGEIFESMDLSWNERLGDGITQLAREFHLPTMLQEGALPSIFWQTQNGGRAQILFSEWEGFGTRAEITCAKSGRPSGLLGLDQLSPQISAIFRKLINLGGVSLAGETLQRDDFAVALDPSFAEFCRFAEAALFAGINPAEIHLRGANRSRLGESLAKAVLHEIWLLLCTSDKRYADVRSQGDRANKVALTAVTGYVAGRFGIEAAVAAAAVSAVWVVVARAGKSALCETFKAARRAPASI